MKKAFRSRRLSRALKGLESDNVKIRKSSAEKLEKIAQSGLEPSETEKVIGAIAAIPAEAKTKFLALDSRVIRIMSPYLVDEQFELLRQTVPILSQEGYSSVIMALAEKETEQAAETYISFLREFGWPTRTFPALTYSLERKPRFAEIVLPAFLDDSIQGLPDNVRWELVLAFSKGGFSVEEIAESGYSNLLNRLHALLEKVESLQDSDGKAWRWDENYFRSRCEAGLAFDALGHSRVSSETLGSLRRGERMADPVLQMFAIIALLRLGEDPDGNVIRAVAADSETRNRLCRMLREVGRAELFPKSELVQEKLAESAMVDWLAFPTELGRAPDEIELMATFEGEKEEGSGTLVFFVFRFCTRPPHWSAERGWMAGVAGPFRKKNMPTIESLGYTFSSFRKWDDVPVYEHLASIVEWVGNWRKNEVGGHSS